MATPEPEEIPQEGEGKVEMREDESQEYDDVEDEEVFDNIEYQGNEEEEHEEEEQEEEEEQYEEEYIEQDGDEVYEEEYEEDLEEEEEEEHVHIHDEEEIINFDDSQEDFDERFDDDSRVKDETESLSKLTVTEGVEENEPEIKSEEKEEEYPVEEQLTAEEKHAEFVIMDLLQRRIDEERYLLRKLRSIISYQSENIERIRRRITQYTKDAQDTKAIECMEKLKVLKLEREKAVDERKVANDGLAVIKSEREEKIKELKKKGIRIDTRRSAYMIENVALKELMSETRRTLTKYNSFAVLKYSFAELDDVIHHVVNVCDDIDQFLVTQDLRPHYVSKLNTKERRVGVLYDKLIKWKQYKVENPDIRPTDYESFLYDPEDLFSEEESDSDKRKVTAPRAIRSVRGDTPPRREERKAGSISSRSPIRAPPRSSKSPVAVQKSPVAVRTSPPVRASPPRRTTVVRRSVRGSISEGAGERGGGRIRPMVRDRPLRAERGGDSPPRRASLGMKRRPPPNLTSPGDHKRPAGRPMSGVRMESREGRRPSPIRRERPMMASRNRERPPGGGRSPRRDRPALLTTPPVKSRPRDRANSFERRQRMRRSPSPGAAGYRGRERENFQISVKNEGYRPKRESFEERPDRMRRDDRGDARGSNPRRHEMRPKIRGERDDTYRDSRDQRPVNMRSTSPLPHRRSEMGGGSRGGNYMRGGSSRGNYHSRR